MTVLLIDDEQITLDGLQRMMPWAKMGIDEVLCSRSGEEAVSLCLEKTPDIIISDVRMPGMTGIELCSWAREFLPGCQLIFISGYADKEYLKSAIQLDAVSYIEKPVELTELTCAVRRAIQRIQKETKNRDNQNYSLMTRRLALLSMLDNRMEEKTPELYFELLLDNSAGHRAFCAISWQFRTLEEGNDPSIALIPILETVFSGGVRDTVRQSRREALTVISAADEEMLRPDSKAMRHLAEIIGREPRGLFGGVGKPFRSADEFQQAIRTSALAKQELFFSSYGHLGFGNMTPDFSFEIDSSIFEQFQKEIAQKDQKAVLETFRLLKEKILEKESALPSEVRKLYFQWLLQASAVQGNMQKGKAVDLSSLWQAVASCDTLEELHFFAENKIRDWLPEYHYSAAVEQTLAIIQKEYADENLNLRSLAEKVYLSPSYLSNVFRQETGETLSDYLTGIRIEHAKRMLKERKLTLYYIAIAVGYQDASYFARVFRKVTGMSPSQYRERNLE